MRSLLVAIYELGVEEIMVIAHSNCCPFMWHAPQLKKLMLKRGIHQNVIDTIGPVSYTHLTVLSSYSIQVLTASVLP